ncbi:MAG: DUF4270 family protein [Bacteroidales bacterium]|nr:DUF4270 family protein [Bacteroidales bacterium]
MKHISKYLAVAALCLTWTACSDDLSSIGSSVRPTSDNSTVRNTTFEVPILTAFRDSVHVRTGYPLLGSMTDPNMGHLSAGYVAQFYASKKTTMDIKTSTSSTKDSTIFGLLRTSLIRQLEAEEPGKWDPEHFYTSSYDSLVGNQIDSMTIRIYYDATYGDSLAPMQVSIYSLNPDVNFAELPETDFYSNNEFTDLYSEKNLLGRKAYTTANRELSDSARSVSGYVNYIEVKLDDKYKDEFLRLVAHASIANDTSNVHRSRHTNIFATPDELRRHWLSGVRVKTTFGEGSIVKVYYTAIYLFYSSYHRYDPSGMLLRNMADDGDSTYVLTHVSDIAVTPDVIQMVNMKYTDDRKDSRMACADSSFISSPLGYYSVLEMPVGKVIATMMNDPLRSDSSYFLNGANFYLKAYKPEGNVLSSTPAPTLLMVQEDSINTYFEEGILPNSATSCYASYVCDSVPNDLYVEPNQGVYYYNFGNIYSIILGLAEVNGWSKSEMLSVGDWEKVLRAKGKLSGTQTVEDFKIRMALVPVEASTQSSGTLMSISNYLQPTAVRLQKGEGKQRITSVYTLSGTSE